jgi:O-acetyl-ADP-ribose deacetylase (regulator of RNase III)/uncharacterized protein YwgA
MKTLVGDILKSKAQTLINTVNCVGVMGKGIAQEFKKRFPEMFEDYLRRCERKEIRLGVPYIYKTLIMPQIINFPTKEHWKSVSKSSDIEKGLDYLMSHYRQWGITSLAVPPLGCGNGQLEWKVIGPLIYKKLKNLDIPVELYAPYGTKPSELTPEFLETGTDISKTQVVPARQPAIRPAWVALVEILYQIEHQPYHWPTGRVIFQKIAYLATQKGLPTGFKYREGSFGPFSRDLKNALIQLINNNLLQEERHGKMFMVKVGPHYEKIREKFMTVFGDWSDLIRKTTDLFMRLNTNEAEIVATVMFATESLKKEKNILPSETEVLNYVMQWKKRRRPQLNEAEVASTIRNLGILRWLNVKPDKKLPVPEREMMYI